MMHAGGGADDEGGADAAGAVRAYFLEALEAAEQAGLAREAVCLDPGIGFGKPRLGDVQLIARLPQVLAGLPETAVLVGASRKRVVGMWCGNPPFEERLPGTLAIHTLAQWNGAHILRVHDVAPAVQAAVWRTRAAARDDRPAGYPPGPVPAGDTAAGSVCVGSACHPEHPRGGALRSRDIFRRRKRQRQVHFAGSHCGELGI